MDVQPESLETPPVASEQTKSPALDLLLSIIKNNPELAKALELQAQIEADNRRKAGYKTLDGRQARPMGTYYKEIFGLQLKPFLDKYLIEQKRPVIFHMKNFANCSLVTLYNRINQSFLWLCNELSKEEDKLKYRALKNRVTISREHKVCVTIKYNEDFEKQVGSLVGEALDDITNSKAWQERMEKFIESGIEGTVFEQTGLKLNMEEVEVIRNSITGIEGIQGIVEPTRVKILKLRRPTV